MRWLALVAVAGCARPLMLVSDVRVENYDLVIERCPLAHGVLAGLRSCTTERTPLPVAAAATPQLGSTPDREAAYRRIGGARAALAGCVTGTVTVTVVLDGDGAVESVAPDDAGDCVRAALGPEPFAVALPRTQLAFAVVGAQVAP